MGRTAGAQKLRGLWEWSFHWRGALPLAVVLQLEDNTLGRMHISCSRDEKSALNIYDSHIALGHFCTKQSNKNCPICLTYSHLIDPGRLRKLRNMAEETFWWEKKDFIASFTDSGQLWAGLSWMENIRFNVKCTLEFWLLFGSSLLILKIFT